MSRKYERTLRTIIASEIIAILQDEYSVTVDAELPLRYYLDFKTQPRLMELREALDRLDRGNYGLCLICGGEIAPGVLHASPTQSLCPECDASRSAHVTLHRQRVRTGAGQVLLSI
jgi:RNA polymerase-binding transcription factor DksA